MTWAGVITAITFVLSGVSFADESTNLKNECAALSKEMGAKDKKFPLNDIKNVVGLVSWRASRCEKPPEGPGKLTRLCDATLMSGGGVFFWEKKTKEGKFEQGYFSCK